MKKLSFYITDADITLRSDHLPLKQFLLKKTLNAKVNNWAVELDLQDQVCPHQGQIKCTSWHLSRLINIDPDVKLDPELGGYEFGHLSFKEILKASSYTVNEVIINKVAEAHDAYID